MTDTTTPEAPVTEAGRVSARETMVHRLEAAVRRHGVTVAPNVWLDDLDAIEAEAVARDREALAAKVRATYMATTSQRLTLPAVLALISGSTENGAAVPAQASCPHDHVTCDQCREGLTGTGITLAATPSPAPTDRDGDLTDIVDQIRPAISNAYYDARNAGETMEDAASRAAGAVLAVLQDAGLRASPAPTAPLDVERLRQAIKTVLYEGRETWGNADHDARLIAAEYARLATPDQRHMGSGSLDERDEA